MTAAARDSAPLLRRLALRAAGLWILLRIALALTIVLHALSQGAAALFDSAMHAAASTLSPAYALPMALLTAAAVLGDLRLFRETVLFANLGVGRVAVAGVAAAAALGMEAVLWAVTA